MINGHANAHLLAHHRTRHVRGSVKTKTGNVVGWSSISNDLSAYRRRRCANARNFLPSEAGESCQASPGAFGIVVLADGASRGGGAASLTQHVIAAGVGRVALIRAGVRVWPGIVRTVERLDVTRPMDDSHRFPYLAGRRRVIIVLLGLATSLVDDLTTTRDGDLFLRHDRRFHAQGCLESYRGPSEPISINKTDSSVDPARDTITRDRSQISARARIAYGSNLK